MQGFRKNHTSEKKPWLRRLTAGLQAGVHLCSGVAEIVAAFRRILPDEPTTVPATARRRSADQINAVHAGPTPCGRASAASASSALGVQQRLLLLLATSPASPLSRVTVAIRPWVDSEDNHGLPSRCGNPWLSSESPLESQSWPLANLQRANATLRRQRTARPHSSDSLFFPLFHNCVYRGRHHVPLPHLAAFTLVEAGTDALLQLCDTCLRA